MKQVLYVGAGAPWMGGAGHLVRQGTMLRALARVARVHAALFDFPADAPKPPFECQVTPLTLVQGAGKGRLRGAVGDFLDGLPRLVRGIDVAKSRAPLEGAAAGVVDAVVGYRIDFAFAAGMFGPQRPAARLVLDVDDPEHLRWRRRMEAEGTRIDWRTERDLQKLQRFEQRAVEQADVVFVCQEKERQAFPGAHVRVVPNGVALPAPRHRVAASPVLLFLGNFAAGPGSPNGDALAWFVAEVWPRVMREAPAAEVRVVGKISEELRARIAGARGVRVMGFAESLEGAFAEARASVAPLRFGTGTRVKILDAWAHGCAVVSTSAGADGLAVKAGENILIGDDAEGFAARCVEVLRDPGLAARLGAAGYRTVAAGHDAAKIEERLAGFFGEFLEGRGEAGGGTTGGFGRESKGR